MVLVLLSNKMQFCQWTFEYLLIRWTLSYILDYYAFTVYFFLHSVWMEVVLFFIQFEWRWHLLCFEGIVIIMTPVLSTWALVNKQNSCTSVDVASFLCSKSSCWIKFTAYIPAVGHITFGTELIILRCLLNRSLEAKTKRKTKPAALSYISCFCFILSSPKVRVLGYRDLSQQHHQ